MHCKNEITGISIEKCDNSDIKEIKKYTLLKKLAAAVT